MGMHRLWHTDVRFHLVYGIQLVCCAVFTLFHPSWLALSVRWDKLLRVNPGQSRERFQNPLIDQEIPLRLLHTNHTRHVAMRIPESKAYRARVKIRTSTTRAPLSYTSTGLRSIWSISGLLRATSDNPFITLTRAATSVGNCPRAPARSG